LYDRLAPLSGLGHGIVHALAELLLNLSQLDSHALADRGAPHHPAHKYRLYTNNRLA
jgi:hypothetical protein